jgi:TolB-like protein
LPAATVATFNPPPHSSAVLPFINMSGDKEQEYFSEGLTEELLNSLAEINGLQVAARTSAFSFQGKDTDLGTIAHKLNVGAILEGSVRRSGHTVRITAQLINAVTGFHLWSKTYDRDLLSFSLIPDTFTRAIRLAARTR